MGLGNDIKKVHMDVMGLKPGQDPVIEAQLTKLSIGIAEAVTKWMMKQEFNITEMKAVVQLEELTTTGNLLADVLSTVQSTIPYSSVMLPSGVPNPIPIPPVSNSDILIPCFSKSTNR